MGRKKKPWINKKTATCYKLVYRSQDDPLSKELDHPQMVLAPLTGLCRDLGSDESDDELEEQKKYGIYFGDDYNYMQHIKSATTMRETTLLKKEPVLQLDLPPDVFPSRSLLPPLPPFDPFLGTQHEFVDKDIEAALEGEFDFSDPDGRLEDDFVFQANQVPEGELFSGEYGAPPEQWAELMGDFNPWSKEDKVKVQSCDDDRQSKFTECSMTSSAVARNEGKQLIDAQFERLIEEYDGSMTGVQEDEVVAVDDVTTGCDQLLEHILKQFKQTRFDDTTIKADNTEVVICGDTESSSDSDIDSKLEALFFQPPEVEQWDCESILSTYSNLYNHPKLITLPVKSKQTNTELKMKDPDNVSTDDVSIFSGIGIHLRVKGESSEDKRERKTAVKKERREARDRKKQTREIYKAERTSIKNRMGNVSIVPVV
ncbi:Protein LTV1-like [Oopsacas minuta]|uniref:Protein LTV1 homolog n=1 Tax=Oopsacas minuta TaxID=111878 RepID=A0AAV7K0Z0_9METZ|nr:Protein LTV1-like [Oopsacas minuta]